MYPTNCSGSMTIFKEIALLRRNKNEHWNHDETFTKEEVDRGSGRVKLGASPDTIYQK